VNIRYQADADLNQAIVTGVLRREPTIDFQTASAAGLQGLNDLEVLALAAQLGRILVTHDRKTMPSQFAEFIATRPSAGVLIVSKKMAFEVVIEELVLIWSVSSAEEWTNRIAKIPL
jgi:predicted nuclease of predicted toxin-antitoxin system